MNSGTYWNDSMNILGKVIVPKGQKVVIHTKALALSQNSEFTLEDGASLDDLQIFVHDKDFTSQSVIHPRVDFSQGSTFKGLVYSERQTELSNNVNYYGAITALYINMHNNSKIHGNSACFSPPEQNYDISVSPTEDLSLICERQPVEFQVTDNDGAPVSGYEGQVIVTAKDNFPSNKAFWYFSETGVEAGKKDISQENTFEVDSNGKAQLWLKSDYVGSIEVTGKLSTDNTKQAVGNYQFVPFKLEIQQGELKTVAGKPRDISIVAKACSDDSGDESIADGYIGNRTLNLSTEYSQPGTGSQKVWLKDKDGNWQSEAGVFEFKSETDAEGAEITRSTSELKYSDAGRTKLTFSDPNCTKDSCDIEPIARLMKAKASSSDDWNKLEGTQAIATRPYTFALCNYGATSVENASGTSEGGNSFVAAGQTFQLKAKPVVWTEGDSGNNDIDSGQNATVSVDSSGMCGRTETPNFYVDGAPGATVALSIPSGDGVKPHSPDKEGAVPGSLTSSPLSNEQIKNTPFSASWSEVGSVWLQAKTQAKYLDMDINIGQRPVGRFYPAYVEVQNGNSFDYPKVDAVNAQTGFAYLGQAFNATFSVLPKSQTGNKVSNYALFNENYQVQLALEAIDGSNSSFGSRLSPKGSWRGWSSTTTSMDWKLERQGFGSNTTTVEPPWNADNSQWGLYISQGVDSTTIRSATPEGGTVVANVVVKGNQTTQEMAPLSVTPELRYGRMRLEDVTVPVTQDAEVPVIVEYYLNSNAEFVLNEDDDASLFGSNYGCSQLIFPDAMRSVLANTPASESINDGEGRLLVTQPQGEGVTEGYREQIRLGQRLSSGVPACSSGSAATSSQPWLQFNWAGEGDTDPSAVVTFGVYRGNDRIIYRGEKGINTMLN
ncbi:hypothetical protein MD588_16610 [Photobacterium sp. SDRW27]|uniref:DUF6701 domain-containing protein n=1 Tax=Photobacterium obscurum TaxID=2829490 RepID=UPI0022433C23|nr:DUF6701 domain-containing protein [Photobacterium obscurum]MCW8330430.1 hypothetical protein [Photobacterium obscurum]